MRVARQIVTLLGGAWALVAPLSGNAQFFLKSFDYADGTANGLEPGIVQPMPDATPAERSAGMVWTMRSALNVAALQCQFEPTLLIQTTYNAILADHDEELKKSWTMLNSYFARTSRTVKSGQAALDQFGTRTYSSFSTVASQFGFCRTAATIGRDALFTPRGGLAALTEGRIKELRNSLVPHGEQSFDRYLTRETVSIPRFDPGCWNKKHDRQLRKFDSTGPAYPDAPWNSR